MTRITLCIFILVTLLSCSSPTYEISIDGFESNRELWGLSISELKVNSLNQRGFPVEYEVLKKIDAGQKGDHEYDDTDKEYGYNWKPQKHIPFNKKSKYYSWWNHANYKEFDVLPITFQNGRWYLLTNWQESSAGGGSYKLFVFVNKKGKFEKHFDVQTGPW